MIWQLKVTCCNSNAEWLPKVTGSHGVHYRYGSAENQQYVLLLALSSFPEKCNFQKIKKTIQIIAGLKDAILLEERKL